MTYLNNAATSHPKPLEVVEAIADALRTPPPSALRSTGGGDDPRPSLRQQLGQLLHIADHERIVLTSGATEALNRLIAGLDGDVIALTDNHNSVLRPLANLPGLRATCLPKRNTRHDTHATTASATSQAVTTPGSGCSPTTNYCAAPCSYSPTAPTSPDEFTTYPRSATSPTNAACS